MNVLVHLNRPSLGQENFLFIVMNCDNDSLQWLLSTDIRMAEHQSSIPINIRTWIKETSEFEWRGNRVVPLTTQHVPCRIDYVVLYGWKV